jgi:hypothetical protein
VITGAATIVTTATGGKSALGATRVQPTHDAVSTRIITDAAGTPEATSTRLTTAATPMPRTRGAASVRYTHDTPSTRPTTDTASMRDATSVRGMPGAAGMPSTLDAARTGGRRAATAALAIMTSVTTATAVECGRSAIGVESL